MNDLAFWLLVIGFSFLACGICFLAIRIIDRREMVKCEVCGQEQVYEPFQYCSSCGFVLKKKD